MTTEINGIEYDEEYKPPYQHNPRDCACATCAHFRSLIRQYGAVVVNQKQAHRYPNTAVAFETSSFGWILSSKNAEGIRRILAQL